MLDSATRSTRSRLAFGASPRERVGAVWRRNGALAFFLGLELLCAPALALAQAIKIDGRTATTVTTVGALTKVTTATVSNANAFNSFQTFGVAGGTTTNLYVPTGAANLINIVRDQRTDIYGVLNAIKNGQIGGNVWFANPNGFLVGASGVVNVGSLTVTTPTPAFVDGFFSAPGTPNEAAVSQLLNGTAPRNLSGIISIDGRVNAVDGVTLSAGAINVGGAIYSRARFIGSAPDFTDVVNANGIAVAANTVIKDGRIVIVADNDVTVSGTIASPGGAGVPGGNISIAAGHDVDVQPGALISAQGSGANSAGGSISVFGGNNATFAAGATIDASAGTSGDGGAIEFSAVDTVTLAGGTFAAGAANGRAGSVLVDPNNVEVVASNQILSGTNYSLVANNSISVGSGVIISTRNIGAGTNYDTDTSAGNSGDISLTAPSITLNSGSKLLAQADNGFQGGAVTLTATQASGGTAQINLSQAEVKGKSVSLQTSSTLTSTLSSVTDALVLSGVNSSDATASIVVDSSQIAASGGALNLGSVTSVNVSATSGSIPLAILRVNSNASVDVKGSSSLTTTSGDAHLVASSTVTTNATPSSAFANMAGDGMVAVSDITSNATVHIGDPVNPVTVNIGGLLDLSATNTVASTQIANAAAAGGSAAGASVAVSTITGMTSATIDGNTTAGANSLNLGAVTANTVTATAKSAAQGAQQDTSGTSESSRTLAKYKDDTNTADSGSSGGGVKVAGAVAVSDLQNTTQAYLASSQLATVSGAATLTSRATNSAAVSADGSATSGSTGVGVAVAVNVAKSANQAFIGQNLDAQSLAVTAGMNPGGAINQFSTSAVSGAGASNVGVAGSIAVNALDLSSAATINSGFIVTIASGGTGDVLLNAENLSTSGASSTPAAGGASGSKVGIGAAVAVNVVSNRTTAEIQDTAQVNGADDLTLRAAGADTVTTSAEAGSSGGTAITPVAAINVVNNTTTASIGSGSTLVLTGDLLLQADQTASASAEAKGSTQGAKAAIGAAVAVALVDDEVSATTARWIDTSAAGPGKGNVSFLAHGSSASATSATASVVGGKSDDQASSDDGDVDTKVGKQLDAGTSVKSKNGVGDADEQSKDDSTATDKPSASSSEGKISVAAAVAVNLQTSSAAATLPDSGKVIAAGAVKLSASNNTDGSALTDGSAVGSTTTVGIGAGISINLVKAMNEASIGQNATVTANGLTLEALMTPVAASAGTDQTNTLDAEAKSGAGGSKVGLAGSLALNIADTSSQALVKTGAQVDAGGGDVSLSADDRTSTTGKALPADGGGASGGKVGIGASVAVNVVANRSTAEVQDSAALNNPGNVTLQANGAFDMLTQTEAGSQGGVSITPSVAISLANNSTTAQIDSGAALTLTGDLLVQADQTSTTTTTAKGSSQGAKAAIGAAVAVALVDDEVTATTARSITANGSGNVSFVAHGASASSASATASAVGGNTDDSAGTSKEDASVDDKVSKQADFGKEEQTDNDVGDAKQKSETSSADADKPSASSSEGKISVAAAVSVNLQTSSATAKVPDNGSITAAGLLKLSSSNNTDGQALSDGSAVGSTTTVGIGAGVSVNLVKSANEASIGAGATVSSNGVSLEALMTATPVSGGGTDQTNTLDAEAKSGAGGSKVGLAGSLALNIADTSSQALIKSGAQVDAGGGDVSLNADDRTSTTGKALPADAGGASGGKVGIGASVAVNVVANRSTAEIQDTAQLTTPGSVTVQANGAFAMDTETEAGSQGGISITPSVAISLSDNSTTASIGTSATPLTLTGELLVQADQTSSTQTIAKGSSQGAKAAIGAAVAVALVDDEVTATTARGIVANGTGNVSFLAHGASASSASATASAVGGNTDDDAGKTDPNTGKEKEDASVDDKVGKQADFGKKQQTDNNVGDSKQQSSTAAADSSKPSASSSEGKISVAAAVAVNLQTSNATATVPAGGNITANGLLKLSSSNNTDGAALSDGSAVGSTTTLGIGAGVSVNLVKSVNEASIGQSAVVSAHGVTLEALMTDVKGDGSDLTNTLDAEAKSGAGGSKVGLAGSLALNIADTSSQAMIKTGTVSLPTTVNANGGAVSLTADDRTSTTGKALPADDGGASGSKVGIGASVAVNVVANRSIAEIQDSAQLTNPGNVVLGATGVYDVDTEAEAGATGGIAITPVLALALIDNTTSARLGTGNTLLNPGTVTITADHASTTTTSAKGSTQGDKAAIGAAVGVVLLNDVAQAETDRNITGATGNIAIAAHASSASTNTATASATGGNSDDDAGATDPNTGKKKEDATVDDKVGSQVTYGKNTQTANNVGDADQKNSTSSAAAGKPSASSDEGKVSVAAAVAVNIVSASATAKIANNLTVTTSGALSLNASGNTDGIAKSDGTVVGKTQKVGIGAAVSVNKVDSHNEASIGSGATVSAHGVTLGATMTNVAGDTTNTLDAEASSGAGGSKVGIAASLALNIANTSGKALINGASVNAGGGDVSLTSQDFSSNTAKAVPTTTGGASGGSVGVGASVALNLITSTSQAQIGVGAGITNAGNLTLSATTTGDSDAEATAGASGGKLAFDAAVAVTTLNQTTDASIESGSDISASGNVGLTSTSSATHTATTKGVAKSGSVAIGASVGVITSTSSTTATIDRNVAAGGTFGLAASSTRSYESVATASAGGSQSEDTYTNNQSQANSSASSQALSKQNSDTNQGTQGGGKVAVAAAVGVTVLADSVGASVAGGHTVQSGGAMTLAATNTSDFSSRGMGDAVDPQSKVGVGVGVGISIANDSTSASLGNNTYVVKAGSVGLTATSTQNMESAFQQKLAAEGVAGAGASKVGVAGAFGVVVSNSTTQATIGDNSTLGGLDSSSTLQRVGTVTLDAENTSKLSAKALAASVGGNVGIGASVATVVSNNSYLATIGESAKLTAGSLSITAINHDVTGGVTFNFTDFNALKTQALNGALLGDNNYYTEAAAGAGGGSVAVEGAFAVNVFKDTTQASVGQSSSVDATGAVALSSSNLSHAKALAGGIALSGSVGVGLTSADIVDTSVTSSFLDTSAKITQSSSISLTATAKQDVQVFGISAAGASSVGVAGVASVIDSENATSAYAANLTTLGAGSGGGITIGASNTFTALNVAGAAAGGGSAGIGASTSTNVVKNTTTAYIGNGATADAAGTIAVTANATESTNNIVVAGAAAGSVAVGIGASVNVFDTTTSAYIDDSAKVNTINTTSPNQFVNLNATDGTTISAVAGVFGAAGSAGVGGGADVGVLTKHINAYIGKSAQVNATKDVSVTAAASENISSISAAGAGGGAAGVAGAASVYSLTESTLGYIDNNASVTAAGNVVVGADSATAINMLAAGAGIGGTAGVGAGAGVAVIDKTTHAYVGDGASVNAYANTGSSVTVADGTYTEGFTSFGSNVAPPSTSASSDVGTSAGQLLTQQRTSTRHTTSASGLAVTATNKDAIQSLAAAGAAAGVAAVSVSGDVYVVTTDTSAYLGNGAQVNQGTGTAGAPQSVLVAAGDNFYHLGVAGSLAGAGVVGVGVGADVSVVANTTSASIGFNEPSYAGPAAKVKAKKDVSVAAWAHEDMVTAAASAGISGTVAVSGSVSVLSLDNSTQAYIYNGSTVDAGGNVAVTAQDQTNTVMVAGSLAIGIGAAGVGAGVGVTTISKDTEAFIGDDAIVDARGNATGTLNGLTGADSTTTAAMRGLLVQADSSENLFTAAVAGGGGLFVGVAGAVSVETVKSNTTASIGGSAQINQAGGAADAAQDVNVTARNNSKLGVLDIGAALGFVGLAGAIDVGTVQNNTSATIGNGAQVKAARDVVVNALATKDIESIVGSAAGGVVGLAGSVAVYSIGSGLSSDGASQLNTSNGNAGSYANTQSKDGTVNTVLQNSSDSNEKSISQQAQAKRGAVNANSALSSSTLTGNTASVGSATINAGRDVKVNAKETLTVNVLSGAVAGGLVGLGAGVSVVSLQDQNQAYFSGGGSIDAGGDLRVTAFTNNNETVKGFAGSGGIVAAQASVATLSDQTLTAAYIGDGTHINSADTVALSATDQRTATTTAEGAAVGAVTAGASVATSNVSGSTLAYMGSGGSGVQVGQSTGTVSDISINAVSTDTANSTAEGAAAGLGLAASGTLATSQASGTVQASIGGGSNVTVSSDIGILAQSASLANAESKGVNLSAGIAAGVSIAQATVAPTVTAYVGSGSDISARSLSVAAQTLLPASGQAAVADTVAGAGGLLFGGSASESHANNNSTVNAYIDTGSTLQIADSISFGQSNVNSSSQIVFTGVHHFNTGDQIVYHATGGAAIDGLQDGQTYYVIVIDAHKIKLASTQANANAAVAVTISANPNGATLQGVSFTDATGSGNSDNNATIVVDSAADTIKFSANHLLTENQAVTYHAGSGSGVTGLQDGITYFVHVVDGKTIQLRASPTIPAPVALGLQLAQAPRISGLLVTSNTGTSNFSLLLDNAIINSDGTITFPNAGSTDPITLRDGTTVVYTKGSGPGVVGLVDGHSYVLKNISSSSTGTTFRLMNDNTVAIAVGTSGGTAGNVTGVSLYDTTKPAPAINAAVTISSNQIVFGSAQAFTDGEKVVYTGSGITGLTSGSTYTISKIDTTHFSLKSNVPDAANVVAVAPAGGSSTVTGISLVSNGATGASLGFGTVTVDSTGKTIQFSASDLLNGTSFQNGQQVVYHGSGINGLTDGSTYYVSIVSGTTIKLTTTATPTVVTLTAGTSPTATLGDATLPGVLNASVAVDPATGILTFGSQHAFQDSQQVKYTGSPVSGLTSGSTYFVEVVSPTQIKLATTISRTDVTSLSSQLLGAAPQISLVDNSVANSPSITSSGAIIDAVAKTITFPSGASDPQPHFVNGEQVTFSGSGITGLTSGQNYYVVNTANPYVIQLAASKTDALATAPNTVALSIAASTAGAATLADPSAGVTVQAINNTRQTATASGLNVGLLAVGSVAATAGSASNTNAYLGGGVSITGGALGITALSTDNNYAESSAGSGGIIAGSAASASTSNSSATHAYIADTTSGISNLDVLSFQLSAQHNAVFNSKTDSLQAALLGLSGSTVSNGVSAAVNADIGASTHVTAGDLLVSATNATLKDWLVDGSGNQLYNVQSGSGGLFGGAAAQSETVITNQTGIKVGSNATLLVVDTINQPGRLQLSVLNDVTARDQAKLDAGGAIAVASAQSRIRNGDDDPNNPGDQVAGNQAKIEVGSNAVLTAPGDITLATRTVADVEANVDAKTYGLAGAAQGTSLASVTASDQIFVRNGAQLVSGGNINLYAGQDVSGVQNDISAAAHTDLWNKTAFPIETNPQADGRISQNNTINVGDSYNAGNPTANARLTAVADVNLLASNGTTSVIGYGDGKDLYREVLAAIGTAVSELFGGGPVDLDIKGGSVSNNVNSGVSVEGTVMAGAHHNQFLTVDAAGNVTASDGVTYSVTNNVSLQRNLQTQIDNLNVLKTQYAADANIAGAFQAEIDFLTSKMASLGNNVTATFLNVNDILARSGNVNFTGNYLLGHGGVTAPGDASIVITNQSPDFLSLNKLTIPADNGGRITMNGVLVGTNADIQAHQFPIFGTPAMTLTSAASGSPAPSIVVHNINPPSGGYTPAPEIHLTGDVSNLRGIVDISSFGDVVAGANIDAETISIKTNGDFVQKFVWGFDHLGGDPAGQYFNEQNNATNSVLWTDGTKTTPLLTTQTYNADPSGPTNTVTCPGGCGIIAGNNVFISAEKLNIDGLIQAGIPYKSLVLDQTALDAAINSNSGATTRFAINSAPPGSNQIQAYYNPGTGKIELDDTQIQGGFLQLYGNIFSTGQGQLRVVDGFGRINVQNNTTKDVVVGQLNVGASPIAGTIKITDTARTGADGAGLTTIYTRLGSNVNVVNSATITNGLPSNVVSVSSTDSTDAFGASVTDTTYQPLTNRRYEWVLGQDSTKTDDRTWRTKTTWGINWPGQDFNAPADSQTITYSTPTALPQGSYLVSGNDNHYFEFTYTRNPVSTTIGTPTHYSYGTDCFIWCNSEVNVTERIDTTKLTDTYRYSVRADMPIGIQFIGYNAGRIDVNSSGGIVIAGGIVNKSGATNLTAGGAISQTSNTVTLLSGSVSLNAGSGIGGAGSVVRIDQQTGGVLNAVTSAGNIYLSQINGPLVYNQITTGSGNVNVTTDTDLLPASTSALIKGARVDLTATSGSIGYLNATGHADQPVVVNTGQLAGLDANGQPINGLNANAAGNIYIREANKSGGETVRNQLLIGANSRGGDVRIEVPDGSLLDNDPIQTIDDRSVTQLLNIWNNMKLVGASPSTLAGDTVTAYDNLKQLEYQTYWTNVRHVKAVKDSNGVTTGYTSDAYDPNALYPMTADQINYYKTVLGYTDAQVTALRVSKTQEYGALAYNPNYTFNYDATADTLGLTKGASWTVQELKYAVGAGALKPTSSTTTRIEDPNITGQNVTVVAGVNVGANNPGQSVVITLPSAGGSINLTDPQILALAAAEYQDITLTGTQIIIAQPEDVNVNGIAKTKVQAAQDIYLGSTVNLNLDSVTAGGSIRIKGRESIINAATAGATNITGHDLIVEAGNGGIGTGAYAGSATVLPLVINLTSGSVLTARAADDLDIVSPADISVGTVFSGKNATLTAAGSILDARNDDQLKVLANSITLDAQTGSIGSAANPLDVGVSNSVGNTGRVFATAAQDVYLNSPAGNNFNIGSVTAGGNVGLNADFDMLVDGPVKTTGALKSVLFTDPLGKLTLSANGAVSSVGGNIGVDSNILFMTDGATIASGTGEIHISTAGDAIITGISTGNTGANAVSVVSTVPNGRIFDGGDTRLDVTADQGAAVLTMTAGGGVGANPIDVKLVNLQATSASGVVDVAATGPVNVVSVSAGDRVMFTATGPITGGPVASTGTGSSPDQTVTVSSTTGNVDLTSVSGPSSIAVAGQTGVALASVSSTGAIPDATNPGNPTPVISVSSAGGSVGLPSVTGQGQTNVAVSGQTGVTLGNTTTGAGGSVTASSAAGNVSADTTNAGQGASFSAPAGTVTVLTSATAGGTLNLSAGGNVSAATATLTSTGASVNASSSGGNVDLGITTAGQGVTFSAPAGTATAATTNAGTTIDGSSGQGITIGSATSGGNTTLNTGGDLNATTLTSTGGSVTGNATGDITVTTGSASGGFTLASATGNVDANTVTANSVALSAPGSVTGGTLNVGENLQLSGDLVTASVNGGAQPVGGSVGGFNGVPASSVNLTLSSPSGFALDSFSAATGSVNVPSGYLTIDSVVIVDRATFSNPLTSTLVDQHDRSLQPTDVQLYTGGAPFAFGMVQNHVDTTAFVIFRGPEFEVITPTSANSSSNEQGSDALTRIDAGRPAPERLPFEDMGDVVSYTGAPVSVAGECKPETDPGCAQ